MTISITEWLNEYLDENEECEYNNPNLWIIDLQFLTEDFNCISNNFEYTEQCSGFNNNENSCNIVANNINNNWECLWIASFDFYTNIPIYWNNTSNQNITIYTKNSEGNECIGPTEENCNQYNDETACGNSSLCEWILSPTYNPFWDTYTETIPQATTGIQHSFFFIGCESSDGECGAFNSQTEEIFCAQIDNQEKCGIIKVIN